jgi:hypothetical protein
VYQFVAPTLCDSTIDGICRSTFFISAMTPDPLVYFDSDPDSGYSIDNLAPCPPLGFNGQELGDAILFTWNVSPEEDISHYVVYRGETEDFDISEALGEYTADCPCDTSLIVDDMDPCTIYYYKITAIDLSGNEGEPTPPLELCAAASVPGRGEVFRFALSGGNPNPFTSATSIAFSIPARQHVCLEVYDVNGRLVSTLVDGEMDAGRHQADWDGTNTAGQAIPAGIYFSRLEAGGKRATEKVILVK